MSFIKTPNLPQNKVSEVIGGNLLRPYETALRSIGIEILYSDDNPSFSSSLKSHADLFVNYLGNGRIIVDNSQKELHNELIGKGFCVSASKSAVSGKYPDDCALNCVITDDIIICNEALTDKSLLSYAESREIKLLNVRQGYCKCSVLPVTESAFITDDSGIFKALKSIGKDALLIQKGSVRLKGFGYGFIGGCAGKLSHDIIAFCGDIKRHSDYNNIKSFLDNYGIYAVSLSDGELTDVGSIIPVTEK